MNGSFTMDMSEEGRRRCKWVRWVYSKRLSDVNCVERLGKKGPRSKVTKAIADMKSRKECVPYILQCIDLGRVDPLHIMNSIGQHWYKELLVHCPKTQLLEIWDQAF